MESYFASQPWDWKWIFYLETNLLGMNEEQFPMRSSRKLISLFKIYKKVSVI